MAAVELDRHSGSSRLIIHLAGTRRRSKELRVYFLLHLHFHVYAMTEGSLLVRAGPVLWLLHFECIDSIVLPNTWACGHTHISIS